MKKLLQLLAVCLVCHGLVGCGRQASESTHEGGTAHEPADRVQDGEAELASFARQELADQELPAGLMRETPPDQIVAAFLSALRSGDSGVAKALLTDRAREETRKRDLTVQPVGSQEARFELATPVYLGEHDNGAHVNTTWTEELDSGVITYDIVWALRRQESGWRVAGMGAQLEAGQPVVYLNFEDPDDMLAKWRQADESLAAQQTAERTAAQQTAEQSADPEVRQAQNPTAPDSSFQR